MKNFFLLVAFFSALFIVSCDDNLFNSQQDESITTKSAVVAMDEATVESAVAEADYETDFYVFAERSISKMKRYGHSWKWNNLLRYRYGHCPDISIDSIGNGYPKTITLNYGDSTVLKNGRVLSGIITIVISAPPRTDGATKEVTYQNFTVDTVSFSGNAVFKYIGDGETSRSQESTSNITISFPAGNTITRVATKTREWVSGLDTDTDQTDDIIQITGYVTVSTSEGQEYVKTIVEPLIKLGDCRFFVQGVVEITLNGESVMTLDYGDGECDNKATLTQNGETAEIDLYNHKMKRNRKP